MGDIRSARRCNGLILDCCAGTQRINPLPGSGAGELFDVFRLPATPRVPRRSPITTRPSIRRGGASAARGSDSCVPGGLEVRQANPIPGQFEAWSRCRSSIYRNGASSVRHAVHCTVTLPMQRFVAASQRTGRFAPPYAIGWLAAEGKKRIVGVPHRGKSRRSEPNGHHDRARIDAA